MLVALDKAVYAKQTSWNAGRRTPHSGLMPANLTTLPHFSVSSATNLPNSAGVIGIPSLPKSARRAFILGSARAALISLLSLSTISAGVFLGAATPYHWLRSKLGK